MIDPRADFDLLCEPRDGLVELPDQWQQGRGLFGGLVVAAMIRAMEQRAQGRPLRSLTAEICGPVQPGLAKISPETLRVGSGVTTSSARLEQEGEVRAHAVGVFGHARVASPDRITVGAPQPPPWADVEILPAGPPLAPVFTQHVELRPVGPLPFSGASEAKVEGWVRFTRPGARRGAAWLAGLIDCYWPALFLIERAPRPMATIAFTFQPMVTSLGTRDPAEPLFFRSQLLAVEEGFAVENRELWGADGALLALNQQTFVVIK